MKWHLIRSGRMSAAMNMGLDEAILDAFIAGSVPVTVRLYGWSPSAVSIGYSQDAGVDANPDECAARGFELVRRITGGGAVFHHGEITYSIVAGEDFLGRGISESCREVSRALVSGLGRIGIAAEFAPKNDVMAGGKKISGSAQARRGGAVLQHGTVLLNLDRDLMFSMINMPVAKVAAKQLAAPGERVTCVAELLAREVAYEEAEEALAFGFADWLGEEFENYMPDEKITAAANVLADKKYSFDGWNFERKGIAGDTIRN